MKTKESPEVWIEPELIVLVRSRPEELVLGFCKITPGGGGAGNEDNRCDSSNWPCEGNCAVEGSS
jgi:hypothetical protein